MAFDTAPRVQEMFSDAKSAGEVADRFEAYKGALAEVHKHPKAGPFVPGLVDRAEVANQAFAALEKSLAPDQIAALGTSLETAKSNMVADIQKDWTTTNPLSTGLQRYDLSPVLQMLIPKATPIRNTTARTTGVGNAHEYRQITGVSNAGVGGVADQSIFFTSDTASTAFGPVNLRRPSKISYAATDVKVGYKESGVSDQVNFRAQFQGAGYADLRQLSHTAALWAHMIGEEKMFLFGRGTDSGMTGATAAPTYTLAASGSGSTIGAGTYYVKVTSYTGFGQSLPGSEVNVTATAGQNLVITLTGSEPAGVVSYGVYAGTASGSETFQGFFRPSGSAITVSSYSTGGAAVPAADGSANAGAYDGILSVALDPNRSGYIKRVNSTLSQTNPGVEFQTAFQTMYAANLADPDRILTQSGVRVSLSDAIKNNGSGNGGGYRLQITQDEVGGIALGSVVTQITNEATGKVVDLVVHPYMPQGCAVIQSTTLPFPDSGIGATTEYKAVDGADMLVLEWPVIQMTYDLSTYSLGTLLHYAPAWNGALVGIA